ncbi:MAG: hypothetical protein BROFUL_03164, partial [Candidatus Brocadia fulgida]
DGTLTRKNKQMLLRTDTILNFRDSYFSFEAPLGLVSAY